MMLPPKLQVALNLLSILFAAFFIAPTAAIVASWNALPGDQLYPTKRTLEKIALYITAPNYGTNSSLQTKLIARRTSEATATLLKKSSGEGLEELRAQAATIRKQIREAPSAAAKRQAAIASVHELYRTKQKLNQTKRTLALAPPPITSETPPDQLVDDIEDTEDEIDDIIDDIEDDPDVGVIPPPSPTPGPAAASALDEEDEDGTPSAQPQASPTPNQGNSPQSGSDSSGSAESE